MKKAFLLLILVFLILCPLSANQEWKTDTTHVSFSFSPLFQRPKFDIALDLRFECFIQYKPFKFSPDFSFYLPPQRYDNETDLEYTLRIINTYIATIRFMRVNQPSDSLFFTMGELNRLTMGDGAILDLRRDAFEPSALIYSNTYSVNLKVDESFFPFPLFGFEYVSNNVFSPSLLGARLNSLPFSKTDTSVYQLKTFEFGLSFGMLPYDKLSLEDVSYEFHHRPSYMFALDLGSTIIEDEFFTLHVNLDILLQSLYRNDFRAQYGVRHKADFYFNGMDIGGSVTVPFSEDFHPSYFYNLWDPHIKPSKFAFSLYYKIGEAYDTFHFETEIKANIVIDAFSDLTFHSELTWRNPFGAKSNLIFTLDKVFDSDYGFFHNITTFANTDIILDLPLVLGPIQFTSKFALTFDHKAQSKTSASFSFNVLFNKL